MSVGFGVPSPFPTASGDGKDEGAMSNRVYCDLSIAADGYLAGPGQTADKPFGDGPVDRLHTWMFDTPDENQAEIDRVVSAGAFVMGRNMFGPIRGDWDPSWQGWWGEDPPYHAPVFCAHPPPPPPADDAGRHHLQVRHRRHPRRLGPGAHGCGRSRRAIAGGAATVNQYLAAGLRTVQLPVHQRPPPAAGVGEEDPDLAVLDATGGVGILALHPGRLADLLEEPGLVHHPHPARVAETLHDVAAHVIAHRSWVRSSHDSRVMVIEALVAWGDVEAVRGRVKDHLDAGADHVCIQVFDAEPHSLPLRQRRTLAMAML
jgi:dihydrofolate reductase